MVRITIACMFIVAVSSATTVDLSNSNEFLTPHSRLYNVALKAFLNALNLTTRLNALQDVSFSWPHNCSIKTNRRFDFVCQNNRNAMGPICRGKNAPIQMAASCQVS